MSKVLQLIEQQVGMWDLHRRLGEDGPRPGRWMEGGVGYGPCLLLSRECGSGGAWIASTVGKRLGWQVFDREIVDQIAERANVRQYLIQSVDERTRNTWENSWWPLLEPSDIGTERYLAYLREVVMTLGHQGNVVLIGRGAHHILPSRCALRVRVVAPIEVRLKRVMEQDGLSEEKARLHIQKLDTERAAFIHKTFRTDVHSALNYDLILNTAEISFEAATETVLAALKGKLG